ncbi:MurR/RpiR family transcriptional regulator [Burkholderiaceae bacterium DAT-1]|nr:MurR/RpiR family transcriptional regulator [Burkholderiaceae bacterium DAT-1]
MSFAQSPMGKQLQELLTQGSASSRRIADFMLRHFARMPGLGIEELAQQCDVSAATISRFARELGFSNYAGMRSKIAEMVQNVFLPVEKLRNSIKSGESAESPSAANLQYAIANIESARQTMTDEQLSPIVEAICKAQTVYIMGFGLSAQLAGLLALHLQPFCRHVVEVAGLGGTEVAAGHLANIDDKDALIVLSFPRYGLDVVRLTRFARDRAARVITITDSTASPLATLADHVLLAPSSHPVLPSSLSAAVAVLEGIVSAIMVSNKENVEKAMRLTEAISAYLHSPDEPGPPIAAKRTPS